MINPDLHLYDTELAGLARRGYQGGMPIQLLTDAFLYEPNGEYFHTIDGRFGKIWRISGVDHSLLNDEALLGVSARFGDVLNQFPEGSCGQFIRHTHRDIRGYLDAYREGIHPEANSFAIEIAESIIDRQRNAAISSDGFFTKMSKKMLHQLSEEAAENAGNSETAREEASKAIQREMREGRYPYVTDIYLVLIWSPTYIMGKLIDSTVKSVLSSVGLMDANKVAYETYNKHAKEFDAICYDIGQSLAAYDFKPEIITGQGLFDLSYQLFNPVRALSTIPPVFRTDVPILEALANPNGLGSRDIIGAAPMFSVVTTEENGWTIRDSGYDYHMRPVSLLGKPNNSFAGMLQGAMTGVECESLITLNWSVPTNIAIQGRIFARARLLAAKESMRVGDKETRAKQTNDLEMVRSKVSTENVNNREQFFDVSLHATLMGFNKTLIEDQAAKLEKLFWGIGYLESQRGDAAVRNSLPLNYRPNSMKMFRRDTPHLTQSLADLCPLYVEYQGVSDTAIMVNNRSGQPIFVDLWGVETNTAHSLICGATGTGKSFAFNNLLMALSVKYRPKVWIIDKGDSYESLCLVLGGNYVRLATEAFEDSVTGKTIHPICINPFYLARNKDGVMEKPKLEDVFFIASLIMMMMNEGNGDKKATASNSNLIIPLLYHALDEFYDDWLLNHPNEEPRFRDFIPVLERTTFQELHGKGVAEAVSLYYGVGPYAALFDGFLEVDWANDLTVLETQRMAKSPALGIVTLALFRQIDQYCKFKLERSRKKICAVDEAWAVLSDPTAAAALAGFYREMRRYGCGCLLISQTVTDFVNLIKAEANGSGNAQGGILENTSHYFFLACSESDYKLAKSELTFSDEEIDLWRSLASLPPIFSEVFYRLRTTQNQFYSGVFRIFAAPMTLWIASSHPDDFEMRERKTEAIIAATGLEPSLARQRAVSELAKSHPFGARFNVAA